MALWLAENLHHPRKISVGFFDQTNSLPVELPKNSSHDNCKLIDEWFKWNMHDNFLLWHFTVDLNVLKNVLNNLHPTIKFSEDQAKFENISETMIVNFLDITISFK